MHFLLSNLKGVLVILLLLFASICNTCLGQVNIFSGFSVSRIQSDALKEGVKNYNETLHSNQLTKDLTPIKNLIGFEIGIRSRYDLIAFEAGVNMRFQNSEAEGFDLLNKAFTEKFGIRYNTYFLGAEVFIAPSILSIGANLGYDKFKIKHTLTGQDAGQKIDNQNGWSSKFFLAINLGESQTTKFIIRPYYQVDWTGKKMNNYFKLLGKSTPTEKINFSQIGISLIFANGA